MIVEPLRSANKFTEAGIVHPFLTETVKSDLEPEIGSRREVLVDNIRVVCSRLMFYRKHLISIFPQMSRILE